MMSAFARAAAKSSCACTLRQALSFVRVCTGWHRAVVVIAVLASVASGCGESTSPKPPLPPFTGERYALVALDGQSLPAPFEFQGSTYLVGAGTIEFLTADTVEWELSELTAVSPGAPVMSAIVGQDGYRQPSRDSVEVGAEDLGAFSISPWAFGRRAADTLTWRTVDPVPSDPRVPDLESAPLGVHVWKYARQN